MRKLLIVAMLGLMLPAFADDVIYLTTEQFKARVFDYTKETTWKYKGDKPCIVDFYTTWCGPCKRLAPILEELSQEYCGKVVFYRADAEKERELSTAWGISSYPTLLYIPVDGKPTMVKGLWPKEGIKQIIEEYLLKQPKK